MPDSTVAWGSKNYSLPNLNAICLKDFRTEMNEYLVTNISWNSWSSVCYAYWVPGFCADLCPNFQKAWDLNLNIRDL